MLSWKQLLLALLPLSLYFYGPAKDFVLDHYATRWYVGQPAPDRSVDIRVHNYATDPNLPITVQLDTSHSRVINFEYADPWNGPPISALSNAQHSETLRRFESSPKHPVLIDEHLSTSSLEDLENQLEAEALFRSMPRRHHGGLKEMTLQNHLLWLTQCHQQSPATHPCCMERAWENWEYLLRGIQNDEGSLWRQAAALQVGFPDFHFAPRGQIKYVLSLPTGHSALLRMQFGPDRVAAGVKVSAGEKSGLQVRSERDLDRSIFTMLFLYPIVNRWVELAVIALTVFAYPWWVPLKLLKTYVLVNQALAKTDEMETAEWEEVYTRIKFLVKDKFDYHRSVLRKPPLHPGSDELFAFLRARLRIVYLGGSGRFPDNKRLRAEIDESMKLLARVS